MADEAKIMSQKHQKWIIDTLNESGGSCDYEKLVEVGEEHHCDTVGAMLKILKNRKVIGYTQIFLMYPMHKDEIITILKPDYDPFNPEGPQMADTMSQWSNDPEEYTVEALIGSGVLYKISRGVCQGRVCAIKRVDTDRVADTDLHALQKEMNAMLLQNHPNLIKYYSSLMADNEIWQVMEYMDKGTLGNFLKRFMPRGFGNLSTGDMLTSYILRNVIAGITYLHAEGRLHRQLQAQNVYVDGRGHVKIGDFGASYILVQDGMKQQAQTLVALPHFSAPEVVAEQAYAMPSDVWCIGILAYEIWMGSAPFSDMSPAKFTEKSVSDTLNYGEKIAGVTPTCKPLQDFLAITLEPVPSKRPTAAKLLDNKFIKSALKKEKETMTEFAQLIEVVPPLEDVYQQKLKDNVQKLKAQSLDEPDALGPSIRKPSALSQIDLSALGSLMTMDATGKKEQPKESAENLNEALETPAKPPPATTTDPAPTASEAEKSPVGGAAEQQQSPVAQKPPPVAEPTPAPVEQDISGLPHSNVPMEAYIFEQPDDVIAVVLRTISETKLVFAVPDELHLEVSMTLPDIPPEILVRKTLWSVPFRKEVKHLVSLPYAIDRSSAKKEVKDNCVILTFNKKK